MKSEKTLLNYELLVLRCRRGEKGALKELILKWERSLLYYLRRLVKNEQDAWDLLQETWIEVLKSLNSLKEPRCLPVWLYRVARNTAMRKLRADHFNKVTVDIDESISAFECHDESIRFENMEQVHHALCRVSLPLREVMTLNFLEDFSVKEIAVILDIPLGTVKSRLHNAKSALRAVLEKED